MTPTPNDSTSAARRRARLFLVAVGAAIVVPALVVGVIIGLFVGFIPVFALLALLAGLAAAAALIVPARRSAETRALRLLDVVPADAVVHARLFNVVEGLCTAAGVARPDLFVLDRPAENAITLGRDARHGCLILTAGLLAGLNRIELEGVIAHELSHLRAGDTIVPTTVLALCGTMTSGALQGLATRLVAWSAPDRREASADLLGVSLTRFPPGLLTALQRIRDDGLELTDVPTATAPLWLAPIVAPSAFRLDERIEALQEL